VSEEMIYLALRYKASYQPGYIYYRDNDNMVVEIYTIDGRRIPSEEHISVRVQVIKMRQMDKARKQNEKST